MKKMFRIIAIAIYFINKYAKQLRDEISSKRGLRNKVKETLYGDEAPAYTADELAVLREYGIESVKFDDPYEPDTIYNVPNLRRTSYNEFQNAFVDEIRDELSYEELEYIGDDILESISVDTKLEDVDKIVKDPHIADTIKSSLEWYQEAEELSERNEKCIKKMHEYLADSKNAINEMKEKKNLLYALKGFTLKSMRIEPIAYHMLGESDIILALYDIDGFKYHLPIDKDEVDESIPTENDVHIDMIPADITIEDPLTLNEAIKILLDFLHITCTPEEYMSGTIDIEDILGFKLFDMYANRRYHNDSVDHYYYDDCYGDYPYDDDDE